MRLRLVLFITWCYYLTLCVSRSMAKQVKFKDCGSAEGQIQSIDVVPCSADPCVLKIGTSITGTLTFIPKEVVTRGQVKAWAIVSGFHVPIPPPGGKDVCENYGVTCPLKPGIALRVTIKEYLMSYFPTGKITLKLQVTEQNSKILFCFELPLILFK